jgi:hypothetical protein
MNRLLSVVVLVVGIVTTAVAGAASQDRFELPQPYLDWERAYLKGFPELQRVMDRMVESSARQMKDPAQDILHNRVCAALAYKMASDLKLKREDQKLAVLTDLLHNISKEEMPLVLTDSNVLGQASQLVAQLRQAGHLRQSPQFWTDEKIFGSPLIGANRALIHHITGALMAGEILQELGGYSGRDMARVQAAIVGHSTGYWYFRQSADDIAKTQGAWRKIYPEPEEDIAKIAHDADLISQFEVQSVIPEGSKWRVIAAKRWGAKNAAEEAHIVYYVFFRLFEEARTEAGKALAREEWRKIQPELIKLMGLPAADDPIKVLGVPKVFQRN